MAGGRHTGHRQALVAVCTGCGVHAGPPPTQAARRDARAPPSLPPCFLAPQGVCTLRYKGPLPIGYGLRAAVRDKFPDIIEVLMIDPDTEEPIKFEAI